MRKGTPTVRLRAWLIILGVCLIYVFVSLHRLRLALSALVRLLTPRRSYTPLLVYEPTDSSNTTTPTLNFTPPLPPFGSAAWKRFMTPTTEFSALPPLEVGAVTGLTGRLRVLVSYLAAARSERRRLVIHWTPDEQCPSTFAALFEPIGPDVTIEAATGPGPEEYTAHPAYATEKISDDRGALLAAMVVALIRPRAALAVRIDGLLGRLGGAGEFSAVHVRRTDMGHVMGPALGYGGYQTFVEWGAAGIAEGKSRTGRPSLQRVFVAVDDPASLGALRDGLGESNIVAQDAFLPPQLADLRQTGVDAAVVDLWTASYAARFLGTPKSSFSALIEAMRRARGLRPNRIFSCVWCR